MATCRITEDLLELLAGERVGRRVTLKVSEARRFTRISVTVGERPSNSCLESVRVVLIGSVADRSRLTEDWAPRSRWSARRRRCRRARRGFSADAFLVAPPETSV